MLREKVRLLYRPFMSEEQTTSDTPKKPDVAGAVGAVLVIILFLSIIGTIGFWPWTTEGVVNGVTYNFDGSKIIKFDDGRNLRLSGQPTRSLLSGRYYKITYNNLGMFYNVEEIEK